MEEIKELLENILRELGELTSGVSQEDVDKLIEAIDGAQKVYVAGAGRSGCIGKAFVIRLLHLGVHVHTVGQPDTPAARPGDLLILISTSGQTKSLISIAESAKKAGASVALVTGTKSSALASLSDSICIVPTHCIGKADDGSIIIGRENKSEGQFRQPMGNAGEEAILLVLDAVTDIMMKRRGLSEKNMNSRHANLE